MLKREKLKTLIITIAVILCVTATVLCLVFTDNILFKLRESGWDDTKDFVRVIDVGQGDSILIHSNGYSALIDTGDSENALELASSLHREGIQIIDVLIFTHLHTDHTGGVEQILKDFKVQNLILPELSTFSDGIYSAELAIDKITRSGGEVFKAVKGMTFEIGDFDVSVIAAYYDLMDDNNRSLIIKAQKDNRKFLFMGDAEAKVEKKLLADKIDIRCDVLKVGHHGSNTSTIGDFLEEANPVYAAISVGKDNIYNHPHIATLKQLEKRGIKTYRTDSSGDITFFVKNSEIEIETEK
ncbi:MAG: MBL fold metallo-hydrolase [Clostridia bacterium]|nr:MBL fold metallo-hydrolase [Clostridia bacterium]